MIKCLVAWVQKFSNDPWQTLACEKQFGVLMTDLRGRQFWFVGKRDYDGQDHVGPFLGEYKTHRGPWRKSMSVDSMLDEWFEDWKLNLQAAMYLKAMQADYGVFSYLRYLVRVAVKPGPYNSAEARERWFSFDPAVWQSLVDGFVGTVTEILDAAELNNWPKNDSQCVNKYKKRCPYWGPCQNKAPLVQLYPYIPHLTHLEQLQPKLPWFDVSSVRLYRECPQRWYRQHVLHQAPERTEALEEGSAFHAGLEILYS